ncbi:MAG TPA: hypothetical protein VG603_15195, partial [Chitinophagales bacterium]|nr:hypothetical protein [Chitinophagales bacterium]
MDTEGVVVKYMLDMSDAKQKLAEFNGSLKAGATDSQQAIKAVGTEIKQAFATKQIDDATQSLNNQAEAASKLQEKHISLRTQLRQNINTLIQMKEAGKENTNEYRTLTAETAKLQHAMHQTREEVANNAAELRKLRAAAEGMKAITSLYELQIGASALLGDKNEELEKSLQKLMGAMAIINGLTEIGTALQKESALMVELKNIKTTAGIALEKLLAEESITAWAAATGGIAIAVAAIGGAIYALSSYIGKEKDHEDEIERINAAYDRMNDKLEAQKKIYETLGLQTFDIQIQQAENNLEKTKKQLENANEEVFSGFKNRVASALGFYQFISASDESLKKVVELNKKIEELENTTNIINLQRDNEAAKLRQENVERVIKITSTGFEQELALYKEHRNQVREQLDKELDVIKDANERKRILRNYDIETAQGIFAMEKKNFADSMKQFMEDIKNAQNIFKEQQEHQKNLQDEWIKATMKNKAISDSDFVNFLFFNGMSKEEIATQLGARLKYFQEAAGPQPDLQLRVTPTIDDTHFKEELDKLKELSKKTGFSTQELIKKYFEDPNTMSISDWVDSFSKKFDQAVAIADNALKKISGSLTSIGDSIFQKDLDRLKTYFDIAKEHLDNWHSNELNQVGRTAQQKEMIDRQYQQRQLKMQHDQATEEARIKRNAAIFDKSLKLGEVVEQTAVNIVKAGGNPALLA